MMANPAGMNFTVEGTLFTKYVFEHAGDEIPLHSHTFSHLSLVIVGSAIAFDGEGKELLLTEASAPVEFPAGRTHGLKAQTDGTVILQIQQV